MKIKSKYIDGKDKCRLYIILIFVIAAAVIILCELFEGVLTNWLELAIELITISIIAVWIEEKHRRVREEANEIRKKFQKLVDTAPDAIYVVDTQGNLKMWNNRLKELTGYTDEELANMNISKLLTSDSLKIAMEKLEYKVRTKKSTSPYELQLRRKDGSIVYIEVVSSPILKNGRVIGLQGFARDITEKKKAEEKMREVLEKEREFKLRTAHFFFNPLAIAKGYLELIINEAPDEEREKLQKAYHAIERVEKVIRNIVTKGEIEE